MSAAAGRPSLGKRIATAIRFPVEMHARLDAAATERDVSINVALTLWGRQVTGLPLDFQFQTPEEFHAHDGERRSAIGMEDPGHA